MYDEVNVGNQVLGRCADHFNTHGVVTDIRGDGRKRKYTISFNNNEITECRRADFWKVNDNNDDFDDEDDEILDDTTVEQGNYIPILEEGDNRLTPVENLLNDDVFYGINDENK